MNLFFGAAWPIGAALSGILFQELGFFGVYYISTSLYIIALFYGLIRIKERPRKALAENPFTRKVKPNTCMYIISDFFNVNHIKEAFHVTFRKTSRKRWVQLCTLLFTVVVVQGPMQGEWTERYRFAVERRFNVRLTESIPK